MLYVIFNEDGSIKYLKVGESIQQGDNLTKQIFAAIEGIRSTDYTCSVAFELPDGSINELAGILDVDSIAGIPYTGYSVTFTEAQTRLAGNLKVNLRLIDLQGGIRCTYQVTLKINPTGYNPNDTFITEAQYNSLLQSLNSRFPYANFLYRSPTNFELGQQLKDIYNEFQSVNTKLGAITIDSKQYLCKIYRAYQSNTNLYFEIWDGTSLYYYPSLSEQTNLVTVLEDFKHEYAFSDTLADVAFTGLFDDLEGIPDNLVYEDTTPTFKGILLQDDSAYGSIGLWNEDSQSYDYLYGGSDGGDYAYPWFNSSLGIDGDVKIQGNIEVFSHFLYQGSIDLFEIYFPEKAGTIALTSDIPAKTSDLQNDGEGTGSPFATQEYVDQTATGSVHFKGTVATVNDLPQSGNTQGDMYWVTAAGTYYIWNGSAWSAAGGSVDLSGYAKLTGVLPRYKFVDSTSSLYDIYTTIGGNDPFIMRVLDSGDSIGYYLCALSQASVGTSMTFNFQRIDQFENGVYRGSGVPNGTTLSTILTAGTNSSYFVKNGPTDYIHTQGSTPGIPLTFNTGNTAPSQTNRLNLEAKLYVTSLYATNEVKATTLDSVLENLVLYKSSDTTYRFKFATYSDSTHNTNIEFHSQVYNNVSGYADAFVVKLPLKSGTVALLSDIASAGLTEITKGSSDTFTATEIATLKDHTAYFKHLVGSVYYYLFATSSTNVPSSIVRLVGSVDSRRVITVKINENDGSWTSDYEYINTLSLIGSFTNTSTLTDVVSAANGIDYWGGFISYTDSNNNFSGRYLFTFHQTAYNTYAFTISDLTRGYLYSGAFSGTETLGNIISGVSSQYYSSASTSSGLTLYRHELRITWASGQGLSGGNPIYFWSTSATPISSKANIISLLAGLATGNGATIDGGLVIKESGLIHYGSHNYYGKLCGLDDEKYRIDYYYSGVASIRLCTVNSDNTYTVDKTFGSSAISSWTDTVTIV